MICTGKRGTTVLEYAALFAIIASAIIAIQVYMQRSFQGRFRMLGDEVGPQYQPGVTAVNNNSVNHTVTNEYEVTPPGSTDPADTVSVTHSITDVTEHRNEHVGGS